MKIVYVLESLGYKGGAERIVSEKMNYLAEKDGYDISVVTCYQNPKHSPNVYKLSDKVKQVHLGIEAYRQYKYGYPKRLWVKWQYHRTLCRQLDKAIASLQPDIMIGMGYSLADVVCRVKTKAAIVIEGHEARPFTHSGLLFSNISWLSKTYYRLSRNSYLHTIEKRANVVVALTEADAKEWHQARRVAVIPDFSSMTVSRLSNVKNQKAIAAGRLEWSKGFDRLIQIWTLVSKRHPEWQLDIYGEGVLENELKHNIEQSGLQNVTLHPFTSDISRCYAESSLCLLTSYFEGFSLVLLEALRHGVPGVTFNCPYGPSEVIDDNRCGYVIDNHQIQQFADKVCYLIEHPEVRKAFSEAAVIKGATYDKTVIMSQWEDLFASLTNEKTPEA